MKAKEPAQISSTCTVWAEQEVVSRLAEGVALPDLVAGIHQSLAHRIVGMVARIRVEEQVVLTGGVAMNTGMVKALSDKLGCEALVPAEPLLTGTLGAALLGKEAFEKAVERGSLPERRGRSLTEVEIL